MKRNKTKNNKSNGRSDLLYIKGIPKISKSIKEEDINKVDYPLFCFKYMQEYSIKDCRNHEFFYKFLLRLKKLSILGWKEIAKDDKHSFGTENIPINQIIPQRPLFLTPDITELMCFRANGDKRPFLGFRIGNIFHVVFIEAKFNEIYNH